MAEAPGFDRVRLDPTILPGLGHVTMWHDTRHGRIEAAWTLDDGVATYTVTLPEGCAGVASAALGGGTHGPGTHEFRLETKDRRPGGRPANTKGGTT